MLGQFGLPTPLEPPMKEQEDYKYKCSCCLHPFSVGIEFRNRKGQLEAEPKYCLSCELDNSYLLDLAENVGSVKLAYELSKHKTTIKPIN